MLRQVEVYVCVSCYRSPLPASLCQTCPFYYLPGHFVDHRKSDCQPLFFSLFFFFRGVRRKPSRLCSPLAGGPLLSTLMGSRLKLGLRERGKILIPLHLFHHPWHPFFWLAKAWPWSDGSAAHCTVRHSGMCTTLLPALSGNLPAWVAKCVHYARYYHIAVLGEVAKCSEVWYAVR